MIFEDMNNYAKFMLKVRVVGLEPTLLSSDRLVVRPVYLFQHTPNGGSET